MNRASFAIALHIHQPLGNVENILERAYNNCYLPFIELLSQYPDIKITLHISGCLIDYFEERYPQFLDRIREMVDCRQIELLGGGYYEPLLVAIPPRDLKGQLEMMSEYINSRFGKRPKGIWIPERVWQPVLAPMISEMGIRYCILDDTHLLKAGVKKEDMYGYFLTGACRKKIAVFASDKKLRYIIPFGNPQDVITYFRDVASKKTRPLFIYGDDGEKFGEWPGTYKWVFEENWLKNFFEELKKNSTWLRLTHLFNYIESHPSLGNVTIPEASYDEMMEWTGGSWLNFLVKYPEANQMHKKMWYVSQRLESAERLKKGQKKLIEARRELYKGQCNCAYWHGVFGGLYLYHLRKAIYNHLIAAERIIDGVLHKSKERWLEIKEVDYDLDGRDEVIMKDPSFVLYIDPARGGVIKELDLRSLHANIINTLSRHKEPYHKKILELIHRYEEGKEAVRTIHEDIKEIDPSIGSRLIYDRYPRHWLRDYFFDTKIKRGDFIDNSFKELGSFSNGVYKTKIKKDSAVLERTDRVGQCMIKVSKEIKIISDKKIEVVYCIKRIEKKTFNLLFGIEFNLTMPYLNSERYRYMSDDKEIGKLDLDGTEAGTYSFGIVDLEEELSLKFNFSKRPKELWYFPVKTVSQSERAYGQNFQSSSFMPIWKLDFDKKMDAFIVEIDILFHSKEK